MSEAEIGKLFASVGLDATGFREGMGVLGQQMKVAQSELQATLSRVQNFGNADDEAKAKVDGLTKQIEIQRTRVEANRLQLESLISTKGKDAKATLDQQIRYNKTLAQLNQLEGDLNKVNKATQAHATAAQNSDSKMSGLITGLSRFTLVAGGATAALAAITSGLKEGVKSSLEFGDSMAKIGTIAGVTDTQLRSLGTGLIAVSNDTGLAVSNISDAEYEAISAGVKTADSIKFLETATKAAKGGFTDTKIAVDGLTTVLNAYGKEAKEASRISDEMMVAQNFGKTTFGDLAKEMGQVAPIASTLEVSTKELFGALAVLTKNGIRTSEAVTSLRSAMANIIKPATQAVELADKLGIEFNAAHLKSIGFAQFLDEVKEKTRGNTAQMAELFGSVEALNSVLVLTGKGAGDFKDVLDQMENSAGLTEEAFKKMDTTGNQLKKSINEIKNAFMEWGDMASPIVSWFSKQMHYIAQDAKIFKEAFKMIIDPKYKPDTTFMNKDLGITASDEPEPETDNILARKIRNESKVRETQLNQEVTLEKQKAAERKKVLDDEASRKAKAASDAADRLLNEEERNAKEAAQAAERAAKELADEQKRIHDEQVKEMDDFGNAIEVALRNRYEKEESIQEASLDKQYDAMRELVTRELKLQAQSAEEIAAIDSGSADKAVTAWEKAYNVRIQQIDDVTKAVVQGYNDQIAAIERLTEIENRSEKTDNYNKQKAIAETNVAKAQEAYDQANNNLVAGADIIGLYSTLSRTKKELAALDTAYNKEQIQNQRRDQVDAIRIKITDVQAAAENEKRKLADELQLKKDHIKQLLESESQLYKDIEKFRADDKQALKEHYNELTKEENIQAEARKIAIGENEQDIITLLSTYNPDWQNAGQSFGQSLIDGLNSMKGSIQSAVSETLALVNSARSAAASVNLQNEAGYLGDLLQNGNEGQKAWALAQAGSYGLSRSDLNKAMSKETSSSSTVITLAPGAVQINAKDVKSFTDVVDMVNKLPQTKRAN